MSMSLQAKSVTTAQVWIADLAIAGACGGFMLAICVLPNLERGEYLKKWAGPLALVCFAPATLAVGISRWAIGDTVAYNHGYNQALSDHKLGTPNVQPTTHSTGLQPFVLDTPQVAAPTAVAARRDKLRVDSAVPAVSAPVRNQFDFLADLDD